MFAAGAFFTRIVSGAPAQATNTITPKGKGKDAKPSGSPATLIKKVTLTEGSDGSFGVYTGTFQVPNGAADLGVRIGFMDSIKVMVPVSF